MTKWQNILVALMVLSAAIYIGRRAWFRIRPFFTNTRANEHQCKPVTCGGCISAQTSSSEGLQKRQ